MLPTINIETITAGNKETLTEEVCLILLHALPLGELILPAGQALTTLYNFRVVTKVKDRSQLECVLADILLEVTKFHAMLDFVCAIVPGFSNK